LRHALQVGMLLGRHGRDRGLEVSNRTTWCCQPAEVIAECNKRRVILPLPATN
jgi:hypothetical protein